MRTPVGSTPRHPRQDSSAQARALAEKQVAVAISRLRWLGIHAFVGPDGVVRGQLRVEPEHMERLRGSNLEPMQRFEVVEGGNRLRFVPPSALAQLEPLLFLDIQTHQELFLRVAASWRVLVQRTVQAVQRARRLAPDAALMLDPWRIQGTARVGSETVTFRFSSAGDQAIVVGIDGRPVNLPPLAPRVGLPSESMAPALMARALDEARAALGPRSAQAPFLGRAAVPRPFVEATELATGALEVGPTSAFELTFDDGPVAPEPGPFDGEPAPEEEAPLELDWDHGGFSLGVSSGVGSEAWGNGKTWDIVLAAEPVPAQGRIERAPPSVPAGRAVLPLRGSEDPFARAPLGAKETHSAGRARSREAITASGAAERFPAPRSNRAAARIAGSARVPLDQTTSRGAGGERFPPPRPAAPPSSARPISLGASVRLEPSSSLAQAEPVELDPAELVELEDDLGTLVFTTADLP
jgi:hypothetical protein